VNPKISREEHGMLQVAPSAFEVIQLQTEREGPAFAALRAEFPRLEALVALLQERRREPAAAYGQRYALELIEHGTFAIPSLNDDSISHAVASLLVADKSVFYAFDNDPDLIVGATFLADGFPLTAIVIPSKSLMLNLGDPVWGMGTGHFRSLARLSAEYPIDRAARPDRSRVTVVTGDPNFAHHIWNQLTAFEALAASKAGSGALDILATHQPLGALRELFSDVPNWSVSRCPDSYLEGRNGANRMFVSLGGFKISRRVQGRVERFARMHLSDDAGAAVESIAGTRRPTFWLSIRTRNRTASNQTDALVAIGRALFAAFPRACIVLDGHSLPADFDTNPSYDRPGTQQIVDADRVVADDIVERLRAGGVGGPGQDIVPLVGCGILDSIALASLADAYFCHHGTVQHKIGWLTDVPGMVHCNRRTLALRPASWVASKVEDGVEPVYIDEGLVEDEAPAGELSQIEASLHVECYRFIDVERLAGEFVAFARSVIGQPPDQPSEGESRTPGARTPTREPYVNGERNAMRPADSAEVSLALDFEHADGLALQRELLRIRNELGQARKATDAITAELVGLAGRLHLAKEAASVAAADATAARAELAGWAADRDELQREIAALTGRLEGQQAELGRRNAVAHNDELVRRDLELLDVRAELHEHQRLNREARSQLDGRALMVEQLLGALQAEQIARAQRAVPVPPVSVPVAVPSQPGRARRLIGRLRSFLGSARRAVRRRTGTR
jgi:hypothetical protein